MSRAQEGGVGIRLVDAPVARRHDPRALAYVVDHLDRGATITRTVEVSNTTSEQATVAVYPVAAEIRDGSFTVIEGRSENELTGWIDVETESVRLAPGERRQVRFTLAVPDGVEDGERYGAVVAALPARAAAPGSVAVEQRVGVRIYLSVGDGSEPASDFEVDSLTAGRDDDGRPVVRTAVRNTGGRAVDLTGELRLLEGPGAVGAGPFPAQLPTTLAPGDEAPVTVTLEEDLPAGPWLARVTLRSGELERQAEATITFPDDPGSFAEAVDAEDVEAKRRIFGPIAAALLAMVLVALVSSVLRRRGQAKAAG